MGGWEAGGDQKVWAARVEVDVADLNALSFAGGHAGPGRVKMRKHENMETTQLYTSAFSSTVMADPVQQPLVRSPLVLRTVFQNKSDGDLEELRACFFQV